MLKINLLNLNEVYRLSSSSGIINSIMEDPDRELKDALYAQLPDGGRLESYPQCPCKHTKYEINLGVICPKCREPVAYQAEQDLQSLLYVSKPVGIDTFINPKIFIDLLALCEMHKGAFNPILYLIDNRYKPNKEYASYLAMLAWDVERNWNYFTANIHVLVPKIFDLIIDKATYKKARSAEMDAMLQVLAKDSELIFCDYIPVINKLILAIETTGDLKRKSPTTERYGKAITDCIALPYVDSPNYVVGMTYDKQTLQRHGNIVARMYVGLAGFFEDTIRREGRKGGLCRSDLFGIRAPFTWRSVIVPIVRPHSAHELHISWSAGIGLLEPFILGELLRLEYSPNEAMSLLEDHRRVYNKMLHDLMHKILYSFTEKGLPASYIRYPSLYRQSNQQKYISLIKADVNDMTTSVPAASLAGYKGDYDGDELTGNIIIDYQSYIGMKQLNLERGLLDINNPYEFDSAVELPKPVSQMWNSFVMVHKKSE